MNDRATYDEAHPPQADPVNFAYETNAEPLDAVTAKAVDAPSVEELRATSDEGLRILWLYGRQDASRAARQEIHRRKQTAEEV